MLVVPRSFRLASDSEAFARSSSPARILGHVGIGCRMVDRLSGIAERVLAAVTWDAGGVVDAHPAAITPAQECTSAQNG
jgi:hypothetical protein